MSRSRVGEELRRRMKRASALIRSAVLGHKDFSTEHGSHGFGVVADSIPKSGTHLLGKWMEEAGFVDLNVHLLADAYWDYNATGDAHEWEPAKGREGLLNPRLEPIPWQLTVPRIRAGQCALAHLPYSPRLELSFLRSKTLKHLFIYRDPRDVMVSYMRHVAHMPERNAPRGAHEYLAKLPSDEQRLAACIKGVSGVLASVREFFVPYLPWLTSDSTCAVSFEDLVGACRGGDEVRQRAAVQRVASFLSVDADSLKQALHSALGKRTKTFRSGVSGSWKEVFTDAHRTLFDRLAGTLLAELGYDA